MLLEVYPKLALDYGYVRFSCAKHISIATFSNTELSSQISSMLPKKWGLVLVVCFYLEHGNDLLGSCHEDGQQPLNQV